VAINPDVPNQVYVAYTELVSGAPVIQVQSSSDGGNTFTLNYTTPIAASLPSIILDTEGTLGMLYLAKVGLNLEVHFIKFFNGSFTPANTSDRVLARFPNNNPINGGDPYVGDYFQLKSFGTVFCGVFCASGNPVTAYFPSGVYYQRDVKVGNVVKNSFSLTADGTLWSATTGGVSVPPSIDPFIFFDIAPEWFFHPIIYYFPPLFYDPGDPYSGTAHISWPVLPTNYPPIELQTSSTLGSGAVWTVATNNAIIQTNGQYEALLNTSYQQQQFFRLAQNESSGQFNVTAASSGNGSLSPNGVLTVNGTASQEFTATPSNNYAIGDWYLDGAVVQSNSATLTLSNVIADHTVLVRFLPTNDIAVAIAGLPIQPGSATVYDQDVTNDLIYYIEVGNTGLGAVTGVTMSNTLPSTVSLVSAISSQGTVTNSGDVITANIGTLSSGATALIQVDVRTLEEGMITDTVSVACNQFEPDLSNNTSTDITSVVTPVAITSQPQPQTVTNGGTANFSVGVSGTPPFYYQWSFDDTNLIVGATNSTLTLTNVTAADAGSYSVVVYQVFAPEDVFQANSQDATLTVQ
jgi:Domain of unknown function DUF11/Immunoglobulin domain